MPRPASNNSLMSEIYNTKRRVEFRDTDAAGIAHFSVFFTMMEEAEHELLRHVGLSVHLHDGEQTISWPRVSASCDFRGAVKFEDEVQIEVRIERLGAKSVTYNFRFRYNGRDIAEGRMTSVCCRLARDEALQSIAIPQQFADKLSPYVVS